jgi:hypothetical protein
MLHESFRSKKIMTKMSIYNLARAHTTHTHAHSMQEQEKEGGAFFVVYKTELGNRVDLLAGKAPLFVWGLG